METFWKYLKDNNIVLFIIFNIVVGMFIAYWLITSGWEDSKQDILLVSVLLGIVWGIILIGNLISWKKLKNEN